MEAAFDAANEQRLDAGCQRHMSNHGGCHCNGQGCKRGCERGGCCSQGST